MPTWTHLVLWPLLDVACARPFDILPNEVRELGRSDQLDPLAIQLPDNLRQPRDIVSPNMDRHHAVTIGRCWIDSLRVQELDHARFVEALSGTWLLATRAVAPYALERRRYTDRSQLDITTGGFTVDTLLFSLARDSRTSKTVRTLVHSDSIIAVTSLRRWIAFGRAGRTTLEADPGLLPPARGAWRGRACVIQPRACRNFMASIDAT